jgi:Uma2 family endonuclease
MTQPTLEQFFELQKNKSFNFRLQLENRQGEWLFHITADGAQGETWVFAVNQNQLYFISRRSGDSV